MSLRATLGYNPFEERDSRLPLPPSRPSGPDFDAALRFLDALEQIYGFTIEEMGLKERTVEIHQYYYDLQRGWSNSTAVNSAFPLALMRRRLTRLQFR
jgi:hypothetical protein